MARTPMRLQLLRGAAEGDPSLGLTASSVIDALIRERMIECVRGDDYRLTPAGVDLLDRYEFDAPGTQLCTFEYWSNLRMVRARAMLDCVCHSKHAGFRIVTAEQFTPENPGPGPNITSRVSYAATSTEAAARVSNLLDQWPECSVTTTAIKNVRHRPECQGGIRPGQFYVEEIDPAPGAIIRPYCYACATACWVERDVTQ